MPSTRTLFLRLFAQVQAHRPDVAAVLEFHERDILRIADRRSSDEERVEAILRVGALTIDSAGATQMPAGSSIGEQRLAADLILMCQALALAEDHHRPAVYRRRARAVAYGIGIVIAAGLSGMDVPGGLDIQIWRACGTRHYGGICDDDLCRVCQQHDRARTALGDRPKQSGFPWKEVGLTAGVVAVVAAFIKALK